MLNRAAIVLKYKPPAVKWINDADPYDDDPGITLESVNQDRTVYLISDDDGDTQDTVTRWVKRNYAALFESEPDDWYTDPSLWPQHRTLELFHEWFEVECHTVLIDTVGGALYDDESYT